MKIKDSFPTALDYLGTHEKVASLMQVAHQLVEIQSDCARILPAYFAGCHVLKLENGTLLIGVPNQATAARLRQKIPLLQHSLGLKGWPVHAIRLKIRFSQNPLMDKPAQKKKLSSKAYESFMELHEKLEKNHANAGLTDALHQLINKRQLTNR